MGMWVYGMAGPRSIFVHPEMQTDKGVYLGTTQATFRPLITVGFINVCFVCLSIRAESIPARYSGSTAKHIRMAALVATVISKYANQRGLRL